MHKYLFVPVPVLCIFLPSLPDIFPSSDGTSLSRRILSHLQTRGVHGYTLLLRACGYTFRSALLHLPPPEDPREVSLFSVPPIFHRQIRSVKNSVCFRWKIIHHRSALQSFPDDFPFLRFFPHTADVRIPSDRYCSFRSLPGSQAAPPDFASRIP